MVSCTVSCGAQLGSVFLRDAEFSQMVICRLLDGLKIQMSKACIDRSDSLIFQHKRRPRVTKYKKTYFGFTYASSEVHFRSTESQTFYWSIMTADDSIKCRCAKSGMTDQVGVFQNPGVCLQAFPSFLPHPLPALLLAPFFARSLTLVPRSLLLNRTETLATQANCKTAILILHNFFVFYYGYRCLETLY